jgi:hypothetical protein
MNPMQTGVDAEDEHIGAVLVGAEETQLRFEMNRRGQYLPEV